MPPDLALWLTLISSNYPCLEHIFIVPKVFELLKFYCIWLKMFSEAVALVGGVRESRSLAPYPADAWRRFDVDATKRCNIDVNTTSIRRRLHPGLVRIHVEQSKTARLYEKSRKFHRIKYITGSACSGQTWDSNLNL